MPTSQPVEILLIHNEWATHQVLEACAKLTPEQFHRKFDVGPGSLHDAVTHILGAMRGWGDMLAGREQRPRLEMDPRTPEQLSSMLEEIAADFAESARNYPVEESVTGLRSGKSYTFTRGAVITHVMTHGMHHRAQCLNMLRHLGVSPLPPNSVVEWMLMVDGQG